jgi:hypothetical protein
MGSDDQIKSGVGKSQVKKRKYDDDYVKFGFTCSDDQEYPRPRCVICGDVLANSSLKPSLLRRHLETRQPTQMNKPGRVEKVAQVPDRKSVKTGSEY